MNLLTIFTFNNGYWFLFAITNFILICLVYKLFGRIGLFAWIAIGTFVANLQVIKFVDLFGFEAATLGNIMYGTIFLATDALNEKYSKKEAQMSVYISFITLASMTLLMQMALKFTPSKADTMQPHLEAIFNLVPRIVLGSLVAFITSQLLDVYLFDKIRTKLPDKRYLWIRNNVSTIISQFIDSIVFVFIAFYKADGVTNQILISIALSTFVIKLIVAILDTPFLYLMNHITPINEKEIENLKG